jgi:3'(2'), 5'-bisphosphate nucleotidase
VSALLEIMVRAARAGGEAALAFEGKVKGWPKEDGSPVTAADHAAEAAILAILRAEAPDIAILSEEECETTGRPAAIAARYFAIDPIDGTREFLAGNGEWAVCVGLVEDGHATAGVIYAPAKGRLFAGALGEGAFEEAYAGPRKPIAVGGGRGIALVSRSHGEDATARYLDAAGFPEASRRKVGSALKFALLAAGEAELYARLAPLSAWDAVAGDALVQAAGGSVKDLNGDRLLYGPPDYVIGSIICRG